MSKTYCVLNTDFHGAPGDTTAEVRVAYVNFTNSGIVDFQGASEIFVSFPSTATLASIKSLFQSAWQSQFNLPFNQFIWLDDKGLL